MKAIKELCDQMRQIAYDIHTGVVSVLVSALFAFFAVK